MKFKKTTQNEAIKAFKLGKCVMITNNGDMNCEERIFLSPKNTKKQNLIKFHSIGIEERFELCRKNIEEWYKNGVATYHVESN